MPTHRKVPIPGTAGQDADTPDAELFEILANANGAGANTTAKILPLQNLS
jgi:hypothetical protein